MSIHKIQIEKEIIYVVSESPAPSPEWEHFPGPELAQPQPRRRQGRAAAPHADPAVPTRVRASSLSCPAAVRASEIGLAPSLREELRERQSQLRTTGSLGAKARGAHAVVDQERRARHGPGFEKRLDAGRDAAHGRLSREVRVDRRRVAASIKVGVALEPEELVAPGRDGEILPGRASVEQILLDQPQGVAERTGNAVLIHLHHSRGRALAAIGADAAHRVAASRGHTK